MNGDERLKLAARALRERYDGRNSQAASLARQRLLMMAAERKRSRVLQDGGGFPSPPRSSAPRHGQGLPGGSLRPCISFPCRDERRPRCPLPAAPCSTLTARSAPLNSNATSEEPTSIEPVAPAARLPELPPAATPMVEPAGPLEVPTSRPASSRAASSVESYAPCAGRVRGTQLRAGRSPDRAHPFRAGSPRSRSTANTFGA